MENDYLSNYASIGYVNFLFGIFCAYWAQMTERNAWAWFFAGLIFGPITGLVLLSKSAHDRTSEVSTTTVVIAVAVLYLFVAWVVFEIVQMVTEGLGLPSFVPSLVLVTLIIGFSIVLGLATRGKFPAMRRFLGGRSA